jgi:indolepyruvate ferredoxin oxidoreductase alpha subunit
MQRNLLLGAEAIGQGAIDGGISGVYAYPGTPSTEITEYIQANGEARRKNIHRMWSVNEKTAFEAALGMSYAGKRSLVCMKHVGLNVAADPFMNACVTGVNGGLVLAVADDPSMHSSQNEQDSRYYGKFGMVPVLEPASQQEAYDMVYDGLELSELLKVPVMLRITTRLAHSRSGVETRPPKIHFPCPAIRSNFSYCRPMPGNTIRNCFRNRKKWFNWLKNRPGILLWTEPTKR